MKAKYWVRLGVGCTLIVLSAIVLFRLSSPRSVAPERPGPEPVPPQKITLAQRQTRKASSITAPEDHGVGDLHTAREVSEEANEPTLAPEPASRLGGSSKKPPQQVATAESGKPTVLRESAPGTQATEIFGDPLLDPLIGDTDDQDWKVPWDAVNELGKLKDPRAVPALVDRALYDENSHPRWRSLWALKSVDRSGSDAIPLLRDALLDSHPEVVRNAAVALAFFGRAEARPELLNGLNDYDEFRRWEAVFSLRRIDSPEVAQSLLPLLDEVIEPEERIRGEVVRTLGHTKSQEVILALVNALKNDRSPEVRWRAAMTLSKVGNASIVDELEQALAVERDQMVREHVEKALTKLQKP